MTAEGDAVRRFRLASPATATVLGVAALVLAAAGIALADPVHQLTILGQGPVVPIVVIYAGVGVVVARRQPRNPALEPAHISVWVSQRGG